MDVRELQKVEVTTVWWPKRNAPKNRNTGLCF